MTSPSSSAADAVETVGRAHGLLNSSSVRCRQRPVVVSVRAFAAGRLRSGRSSETPGRMDPSSSAPPPPDHSLLDIENVTSDEWRAVMTNRLVKQKDMFIAAFKKKIVDDVNACVVTGVKQNATVESLRKNLMKKINENQFELEYQVFADGIVGATFEYVCQLIIKNSLDNIKRTQNALNSFSSTPITNDGTLQPCCNIGVNLQGSSYMTQIQCLPESNNTNDLSKVIQPIILSAQNEVNFSNTETGNYGNIIANEINTTTFQNNRNLQKKNNLSVSKELNISSKFPIESSFTIHSSEAVEKYDDLEHTQALTAMAKKISEQGTNFGFVDGFDDSKNTDSNNKIIDAGIQTNNLLSFENGELNIGQSSKIDEQLSKIDNSLKILESLVNIEHNKLDVQELICTKSKDIEPKVHEPTIVELEVIEPEVKKPEVIKTEVMEPDVIKTEVIKLEVVKQEMLEQRELESQNLKNEKNHSKGSNKKKLNTKEHCKSKKRAHKSLEENKITEKKQKNHNKKSNKSHKQKNSLDIYRKLKDHVNLEKTLSRSSCNSTEKKNSQNISLVTNGLPVSCSSYQSNAKLLITTNTQITDNTNSLELPLVLNNSKDDLPNNKFKMLQNNVENTLIDKKECNTTNISTIKSIVTTKSSVEKSTVYLKNKLAIPTGSVKKLNYKQIYEKDRKSLFSPDIIFRSTPLKNSTTDLSVHNKKHSLTIEKIFKTPESKSEINSQYSNNKKRKRHQSCIEVKITNKNPKIQCDKEPKSNGASSSFNKKSSSSCSVNGHSKFKRLKIECESDDESKMIEHQISTEKVEKTGILENNVSNVVDTSLNTESSTSNVLESNESNEDNIIQRLLKKHNLHNSKMLYIVIEPGRIYS